MKRATFGSLACSLLLALAIALPSAASAGEQVSLEGEVVDLACYLPRGEKGRGEDHRECAQMCAEGGAPLGLLGKGGELVLLVEDHAKPAAYEKVKQLAGGSASIKGERFSRGGIAAVVVQEAEER